MMGTLFVLVRGGIAHYSLYINATFMSIAFQLAAVIFMGSNIFYRFSLKFESKSREVWLNHSVLAHTSLTRYDRAVMKSCRPISIQIGPFFSIENTELPLIFFGVIIGENTINFLLTFS